MNDKYLQSVGNQYFIESKCKFYFEQFYKKLSKIKTPSVMSAFKAKY
jgi:hypothetical protein